MSNTCKCLFLPDASIYLLSTYGNNASNQGYNINYGSNYGGATANAFDGFKTAPSEVSIMPSDGIPIIFLGLKLTTNTPCFPIKS